MPQNRTIANYLRERWGQSLVAPIVEVRDALLVLAGCLGWQTEPTSEGWGFAEPESFNPPPTGTLVVNLSRIKRGAENLERAVNPNLTSVRTTTSNCETQSLTFDRANAAWYGKWLSEEKLIGRHVIELTLDERWIHGVEYEDRTWRLPFNEITAVQARDHAAQYDIAVPRARFTEQESLRAAMVSATETLAPTEPAPASTPSSNEAPDSREGASRELAVPDENRTDSADHPLSIETRALAEALVMAKNRERINIARIARQIGCNCSYLYDCKIFMDFVSSHKPDPPPRGSKDRDTRTIEAVGKSRIDEIDWK